MTDDSLPMRPGVAHRARPLRGSDLAMEEVACVTGPFREEDIPALSVACSDADCTRIGDWLATLGCKVTEVRFDMVQLDDFGTIVVLRDPISGESMTIGAGQ